MTEKNVAMFVQKDGERVQVGWASSAVNGVRTWDFLPGHENVKLRDVSFEDDENSRKVAEESSRSGDETTVRQSTEPISIETDETQAAEPVDAGVELVSGGEITEVDEDDEDEDYDEDEEDYEDEDDEDIDEEE